jgi:uncharacterized membrane protein
MPKTKTAKKPEKDALYIFTYLLTIVSGLIVFVTVAQKSTRAKFHAIQAILLGVVMIIVGIVGGIIFAPAAGLLNFLIWLYGIYIGYRAYEGEDIEVPVLGDFAKQYLK